MQIDSVETNAGAATCCAESRIDRTSGFFSPMLRCVFSISTVASSTRIPTASASPPSVITLIVSPSAVRMISEVAIESGIEIHTISVRPPAPQEQKNHQPRQPGCNRRLAHHLED